MKATTCAKCGASRHTAEGMERYRYAQPVTVDGKGTWSAPRGTQRWTCGWCTFLVWVNGQGRLPWPFAGSCGKVVE